MADRASDEQVAALQQAAIDFRNPDHIPSSAGWWLGKAVDALLAERARAEAAESRLAVWSEVFEAAGRRADSAEAHLIEAVRRVRAVNEFLNDFYPHDFTELPLIERLEAIRHANVVTISELREAQEAGEAKLSAVRELADKWRNRAQVVRSHWRGEDFMAGQDAAYEHCAHEVVIVLDGQEGSDG